MLNMDILKANVIRLSCGMQEGTAFLINSNTAITARHCVTENIIENAIIKLDFLNLENKLTVNGEVINREDDSAIAFIKLNIDIEIEHIDMAILNARPERDEKMITYGYPASERLNGWILDLNFADDTIGFQAEEADWRFRPELGLANYKGYSGSPLVFEDKIIGTILQQNVQYINEVEIGFSVNAISNQSIAEYLGVNGVKLEEIDYKAISQRSQAYRGLANIPMAPVGMEVNRNNYNSNAIVKVTIPSELKEELETEYREKIEVINRFKREGRENEAWDLLRQCINKIRKSAMHDNALLARFYYIEAIWYLEDKSDGSNAQKYYNKAIELNPNIDTRIFTARKRYLEGNCLNVLDTLQPLDNISIVNTYLQLCVYSRDCDTAIKTYEELTLEPNENTFYMMSLIYILQHDLEQAELCINMTLELSSNVPVYHMMKGVVFYWRTVPADIVTKQDLLPVMFETSVVHVSNRNIDNIDKAIECYHKAYDLAKHAGNVELIKTILKVWLDTLSISMKHEKDSLELIDKILEIDSMDPMAITWKCHRNTDVTDYTIEEIENKIHKNTDNKLSYMIALINICLAKNDKDNAKKYLSKYQYEFNRLHVLEYWFDLRIRAVEDLEEIDQVELQIIRSQVNEDFKKRFKGVLLERKNCSDELIEYAISLFEETGLRIDLINLVHSCDKFGRWSQMEEYAHIWASKYDNEHGKCNIIKAQLMQYEWEKCLNSIKEYENVYQLSEETRFYKAQALKVGRKYLDAITETEMLWKNNKTTNILLLLAECYILEGQEDEAILKLKEGISQGIRDPQIYIMLAEHLKLKSSREAKKYAMKAYYVSNESRDIMLWCIHFLYQIGESAEAGTLLSRYQIGYDAETDKNFRSLSVKEALVIIDQMREQYIKRLELYTLSKIPYHVYIDMENRTSYSMYFWSVWDINSSDNFDNIPLYSIFGAHNLTREDIVSSISDELILDYSSCIFLYELDLLDILASRISRIWVSGNIFSIISKERSNAFIPQIDYKHRRKKVMDHSKELNIIYHKYPDAEKILQYDNRNMQMEDIINYEEANAHHLLWIEERLSTDILGDKDKVSEEIKGAAVRPVEFLSALVEKGIISRETFERYSKSNEQIRTEVIQNIVNSNSKLEIFVDFEFFEILDALKCLTKVGECCEIHAFDNIFDLVSRENDEEHFIQKVQTKLEDLQDYLLQLKEDEMIKYVPYIESGAAVIAEREEHIIALKDTMHYCGHKKIPFVCDDRMISSYNYMGDTPLLCGLDIIEYLYVKKAITSEVYYETIKKSLDKNISYFIPSFDYMKFALQQTPLGDEEQESLYLISVRRYMQRITSPDSALMRTVLDDVEFPEVVHFMGNLQKQCMRLLTWVWGQEKEVHWKQKKSTWLINYFSEFGYAFSFLDESKGNIIKYKAARIADFIFRGVDQIADKQSKAYYYKWLFRWLKPHFLAEPDLELEIETYLGEFLEAFLKEHSKWEEEKKAVAVAVLLNALKLMPDYFCEAVVNNPKMRTILETYTTGITILGSGARIRDNEFNKWIEASMAAGKNNEILRDYDGIQYRMSFRFNEGYVQGFTICWNNGSKEERIFYVFEGACLSSKNNLIRIKGFNKIADFLTLQDKHFYEKKNSQGRDLKIVEEIIEKVEQSSRFWMVKLGYILDKNLPCVFYLDDLFPKFKNVFDEILSSCELKWCEASDEVFNNIYERLTVLLKLPIGLKGYTFLDAIDVIIKQGLDSTIIDWCTRKLNSTHNPIELANLLYVFNKYDKSRVESVVFKILEEDSDIQGLFIELTKFAWYCIETDELYYEESLKNKLLYSYIFAGEVYERLISLNENNRLRNTLKMYSEWLSGVNTEAGLKTGYLNLPIDEDVCSPRGINRITVTATVVCNFLYKNHVYLTDKGKFKDILEVLVLESSLDPDLYLEFLLSDKERPNILQTEFSGSLFELISGIARINHMNLPFEELVPDTKKVFSELSQKLALDIKDFVFLYIYSKDSIQIEWMPDIIKIIDNYSIIKEVEYRAGKFQCIISLLQKCPTEYQENQIVRFRDEIKHIFLNDSLEFFDENIITLEIYCAEVDKANPFNAYLDILEEITKYNRLTINSQFMDMFSAIQSRLEGKQRKRANLLRYRFEW